VSSGRPGGPVSPGIGDLAHPRTGVAICDGDRVRVANEALARLAGVEGPDKLAGQRLGDLLEHEGPHLPGPGRAAHACRLHRGDGSRLPVEVHVVDVPPEDASVWVFEDVSRVRALEERLAREVADREELLTMVSHELRTPVTVVAGYARMLLTDKLGPLTPEQRRCVAQCERSSRRLVDLIGRLLEGAARARGEVSLQIAAGEVVTVVEDVSASLAPLLEPDRLRLEVSLDPGARRARFAFRLPAARKG
jgi:two-component system phosphate regulon sensor histidine kinase PhoR